MDVNTYDANVGAMEIVIARERWSEIEADAIALPIDTLQRAMTLDQLSHDRIWLERRMPIANGAAVCMSIGGAKTSRAIVGPQGVPADPFMPSDTVFTELSLALWVRACLLAAEFKGVEHLAILMPAPFLGPDYSRVAMTAIGCARAHFGRSVRKMTVCFDAPMDRMEFIHGLLRTLPLLDDECSDSQASEAA